MYIILNCNIKCIFSAVNYDRKCIFYYGFQSKMFKNKAQILPLLISRDYRKNEKEVVWDGWMCAVCGGRTEV